MIEWSVESDSYNKQLNIPSEVAEQAAEEGISTENKQRVGVQLTNLTTGEIYIGRLGKKRDRQ